MIPRNQADLESYEECVLGAMLVWPEEISKLREIVQGKHFSAIRYHHVWSAICSAYDEGVHVDTVTVGKILADRQHLDELKNEDGEKSYFEPSLTKYTDRVCTRIGVDAYARIVREDYYRRLLLLKCREIYKLGDEPMESIRDYVYEARRDVNEIANEFEITKRAVPLTQLVGQVIETANSPADMILTGWEEFDLQRGGLPRTYIVVGGYPGSGKSTLLWNLAANVAVRGKRVLFFSLEDSQEQGVAMMLSRFGGINSELFTRRELGQEGNRKAMDAANIVHKLPIIIDDRPRRSISDISDTIARHHGDQPLDLVLVDHLGKIHEKAKDRYHALSAISLALADIQKEYGFALIAASQLNRPQEDKCKPPSLRQLRDAGNIEADARMVMMIHRPHYYYEIGLLSDGSAEPDVHELGLLVEKVNRGRPAKHRLYIDLETSYIGDKPPDFSPESTKVYGGHDGYN